MSDEIEDRDSTAGGQGPTESHESEDAIEVTISVENHELDEQK